jgi:hypothetical protein
VLSITQCFCCHTILHLFVLKLAVTPEVLTHDRLGGLHCAAARVRDVLLPD